MADDYHDGLKPVTTFFLRFRFENDVGTGFSPSWFITAK